MAFLEEEENLPLDDQKGASEAPEGEFEGEDDSSDDTDGAELRQRRRMSQLKRYCSRARNR
ncbi:MAG: hypothetical protein IPP40_02120 [bacterium]|nr:hypothetical protein [bacterium]